MSEKISKTKNNLKKVTERRQRWINYGECIRRLREDCLVLERRKFADEINSDPEFAGKINDESARMVDSEAARNWEDRGARPPRDIQILLDKWMVKHNVHQGKEPIQQHDLNQFVGWYFSEHEQGGVVYYGFFRIFYDNQEKKWKLGGTTVTPGRPYAAGSWRSDNITFDNTRQQLIYIYYGHGEDSISPGSFSADAPGLAGLDFEDLGFSQGRAWFHDARESAPLVEAKFRKITTEEIVHRISGRALDSCENMLLFVRSLENEKT